MNELATARLILKPLQPEHAAGLLPVWSDPDVVRFTYLRLAKDANACAQSIAGMLESSRRREDTGPYTIFLGETPIGMAGAVRIAWESGEHELYFNLGKQWWGNGYATEAALAVMEQVFSAPLVHRVCAEVVTANTGSIRVLEKTGMKQEGRLRGKFFKDGIYRDLYLYSILRHEWEQRHLPAEPDTNQVLPAGS